VARATRPCFIKQDTGGSLVPHKNQTAHEVTRDVTAWASQIALSLTHAEAHVRVLRFPTSGLGPMLSASSSRPGPASARSARTLPRLVTAVASLAQTVSRESFSRPLTQVGWRSGFPTGRPWDFALDRGLLIRIACATPIRPATISRTLFLGSRALCRTSSAALARWVRRIAGRGTLFRGAIRAGSALLAERVVTPLRHWRRL